MLVLSLTHTHTHTSEKNWMIVDASLLKSCFFFFVFSKQKNQLSFSTTIKFIFNDRKNSNFFFIMFHNFDSYTLYYHWVSFHCHLVSSHKLYNEIIILQELKVNGHFLVYRTKVCPEIQKKHFYLFTYFRPFWTYFQTY